LLALVPLFLVWFGGEPVGIYLYIVFAIAMLMVAYTVNAIQNVHPMYGQFAQTLGASPGQLFLSVYLPAVVPELFGGIRVALGITWGVTPAAEYLAAQASCGSW
jgi:ABC-type nitrate/sulfonate/bicarbonate transport system permease component